MPGVSLDRCYELYGSFYNDYNYNYHNHDKNMVDYTSDVGTWSEGASTAGEKEAVLDGPSFGDDISVTSRPRDSSTCLSTESIRTDCIFDNLLIVLEHFNM